MTTIQSLWLISSLHVRRSKDGDEEPDDFFDDDSRRQDEKERRDNYFTPMDDGVDFGDDWSESSDSGIDRPKKENVWCRSLFIDDAVERDDCSDSIFGGTSAVSAISGNKAGSISFSASVAEEVFPVNSGTEAGSI